MENYNYKVIAELREDLTDEERTEAQAYIAKWQGKFELELVDGNTYRKAGVIKGHSDFGSVTFFFFKMEEIGRRFSKLEYYDLYEEEMIVAV